MGEFAYTSEMQYDLKTCFILKIQIVLKFYALRFSHNVYLMVIVVLWSELYTILHLQMITIWLII